MATLADVINAGLNYGKNYLSIQDSINKENANIRIQSAQLDFQSKTNDFMRSLEGRSDYNNFEQDLDTFLNNYTAEANKMAKSPYEAQAINQMLSETRVNLQDKIRDATMQAQKNDSILVHQENELKRQQLKKDGLISSTDQIAQNQSEIDNLYLSGTIDKETAMLKNKETVLTVYGDDVLTQGMNVLDQGGTLEEALSAIDSFTTEEYKAYITDANTGTKQDLVLDFDSVKEEAKKSINQYHNTAIKELQTNNAKKLSDVLVELYQAPPSQQTAVIQKGQQLLASMNGNKLSTTDREKYARAFKSTEETLSSSSGTSSSGKTVSQQAAKSIFDTDFKAGLQMVKDGNLAGEELDDYITESLINNVIQGNVKGYNATDRETAIINLQEDKELYVLFGELGDEVYKEISSIFPIAANKVKDIQRQVDKGEIAFKSYEYAVNAYKDFLLNKNIKGLTDEECVKQLDTYLKASNLENIKALTETQYKMNDEKGLSSFISTLNSTDEAYTKDGQTVFAEGLSEESLYQSGGGIDTLKNIVAGITGTDASEVKHVKTMKDNDVDYEAKFTVNGETYEFRATTKDRFIGSDKPTYEIVDSKGNVISADEVNKITKEKQREQAKAQREANKQAQAEAKLAKQERIDSTIPNAVLNVLKSDTIEPVDIGGVINIINKKENGHKEALEYLGVTIEQWDKLNEEEKEKLIINRR